MCIYCAYLMCASGIHIELQVGGALPHLKLSGHLIMVTLWTPQTLPARLLHLTYLGMDLWWVEKMQHKEKKGSSCVSPWQPGCPSCNTSAALWVSAPGPKQPSPPPSVGAPTRTQCVYRLENKYLQRRLTLWLHAVLTLSFSNKSDSFSSCLIKSKIKHK